MNLFRKYYFYYGIFIFSKAAGDVGETKKLQIQVCLFLPPLQQNSVKNKSLNESAVSQPGRQEPREVWEKGEGLSPVGGLNRVIFLVFF